MSFGVVLFEQRCRFATRCCLSRGVVLPGGVVLLDEEVSFGECFA